MTILNPYLGFRTNAREALDFYQSVFGGEITRSTFADLHASDDPAEADLVMHSQLSTPNGLTLMASDTPKRMELAPASSISVSLSGGPDDHDELMGYWARLSDGATITAPMNVAPWGDSFGMCVDRFGTNWLINIAGAQTTAA